MRIRMIAAVLGVAAVIAAAGVAPAAAGVSVNIQLGAPPQLAYIPGSPVEYAPALPANYFFYGGQYYVFTNGSWFVSRGYNGPWVVVGPAYVPAPIWRVPVGYYRAAPVQWRSWDRGHAPHWRPVQGRDYRVPPGHRDDHRNHNDQGRHGDHGQHGDHGRPNRDRH